MNDKYEITNKQFIEFLNDKGVPVVGTKGAGNAIYRTKDIVKIITIIKKIL